jgi:deoxyribonuclease-4
MPLFGAHLSIAGGFHKALETAHALGCDTVQLFVSQPRTWPVPADPAGPVKEIAPEEVQTFRRLLRRTRLRLPLAHASYLINLASPDKPLYRRSIEAFLVELRRCELLHTRYLVIHPGAAMDGSEEDGLVRVAAAFDEIHDRCPGFRAQILLETTAGQGSCLGHRFEHLARVLSLLKDPARVGVCLDTCHVFAAGYALAPEREYRATFREFDRLLGLSRLRAFHVNDSLKPQGSRVDRHAHIGQGHLGIEPFRLLVNDRRFRTRPFVLETPKEADDGGDMDPVNLAVLRGLVGSRGVEE